MSPLLDTENMHCNKAMIMSNNIVQHLQHLDGQFHWF